MASSGPLGEGDDPFRGVPFLGDLARLLQQQQGQMPWDAAKQLAVSVATEGVSESNVDPVERMAFEQLARVAELQIGAVTDLPVSLHGGAISIAPVNRTQWIDRSIDAYRPLLESLAASLGARPPEVADAGAPEGDPLAAMLAPLMSALAPMMLGMTAGSMLGHLARRALGQYDLPIPRPLTSGDQLLVVVPSVDAFGEEWSLPKEDLRLWVCLHEVAHHAVLNVPHVRDRLLELLQRYAAGFQPDASSLEERLTSLDIEPASADPFAGLQKAFGDPEVLLGAIRSPDQLALLPELEALVAVVVGYVDHLMDTVGAGLIGTYDRVTEALRRRRVEADPSDRFVERLLGLELTQAQYDRGAAFIDGVVERAGREALARLWTEPRMLPTPAEVDAPGLWLARIDLPD